MLCPPAPGIKQKRGFQHRLGVRVLQGRRQLEESEVLVRNKLQSELKTAEGQKNRVWLWEWVAEEKAERSPKLKRFRKPEAVGRLMTEELGEERWESFKT